MRIVKDYCDVPNHCFPTSQGLAGHVSQTGHQVEGRATRPDKEESYGGGGANPLSIDEKTGLAERMIDHLRQWLDFEEMFLDSVSGKKMGEENMDFAVDDIIHYVRENADLDYLSPIDTYSYVGAEWVGISPVDGSEDVVAGWADSPDSAMAVPLVLAAMYKTGNYDAATAWYRHFGKDTEQNLETLIGGYHDSESVFQDIDELHHTSAESVRRLNPTYDPETDTVEVYRGVKGGLAKAIQEAVADGEDFFIEHRPLESWSVDAGTARYFSGSDGVILKTRIPVNDVMVSYHVAGELRTTEGEYAVMHGKEPLKYKVSNVIGPDVLRDESVVDMRRRSGKPWVEHVQELVGEEKPDFEEELELRMAAAKRSFDAWKKNGIIPEDSVWNESDARSIIIDEMEEAGYVQDD